MAEIGELCETRGELTIEWRIKHFSSLQQEIDERYESPKFYFSSASWTIELYTDGETEYESNDWLRLYVVRKSSGSPVTLDLTLGLKKSDGQNDLFLTHTYNFTAKDRGYGRCKAVLKTVLMEKKFELIPSDTLTVICCMKNNNPKDVARSLFSRYQELSDNLKEIYEKGIRTDCILKVDGADIAAHRMILETRSPVFAAVFKHDTKENETGEIAIVDIDKSAVEGILQYVYSGDIEELEIEKALSVYAAAEKYDINNVKQICSEFIIRNISDGCVCDVIKFGELYQDEKIGFHAREYFKENVRDIIKTDKWTTFAKENHEISMELFDCVVTAFAPDGWQASKKIILNEEIM